MRSDTLIKNDGVRILVDKLGLLEAERFMMLIKNKGFDYTQWREDNLCKGMKIEDIEKEARKFWESEH
jgi:hypothetical protein